MNELLQKCPLCEGEPVAIITRPDKTRYCSCLKCGEKFIPGGMMNENLKILRSKREWITTLRSDVNR